MLTLTRVGTQQEAEEALALVNKLDYSFSKARGSNGKVIDGWEIMGEGSNRLCLLSPDRKTVYKIQYNHDDYSNKTEWKNYKEYAGLEFEHFRIAKCTLYDTDYETVIAMEYVPGAYPEDDSICSIVCEYTDITDMWYKNIIVPFDGSIPVVIDMGE